MIIRKYDDYFLIKIFKENLDNFNIFDIDSIKVLFKDIINKLKEKYDLCGLIDTDVYVNNEYGLIIEMRSVCDYFDEIDIKIKLHLNKEFLVIIDNNSILDYDNVYYYNGKFYGTYLELCDNEVFYKDTDKIIHNGIKIY